MIRLGIIGLGRWGERLVEAVQGKSDRVRFVSALVRRPERAAAFAKTHGLRLGTDQAVFLRDAEIDGVVSCGPAYLHADHALAAMQAGKPVLGIKPLGQTVADAERLEAASKATGKLLALGYNRCFMPNVLEMRKRLASGMLGRLLHAEGNFCTDRYRGIGGSNWKSNPQFVPAGSLADHMLYLVIETLGPIAEAHTVATNDVSQNDLADSAAVLLRTKANTSAFLTAIGVTPDYYRFQLFGTNGWMELKGSRQLVCQTIGGEREEMTLPEVDPERAQLEAFADAISGRAPFPVPLADATHSIKVLEAMGRSALEARPIAIP